MSMSACHPVVRGHRWVDPGALQSSLGETARVWFIVSPAKVRGQRLINDNTWCPVLDSAGCTHTFTFMCINHTHTIIQNRTIIITMLQNMKYTIHKPFVMSTYLRAHISTLEYLFNML